MARGRSTVSSKHVPVIQIVSGSGELNQSVALGQPNDRGCVSCGTVYVGEAYTQYNANVTLIADGRGRYWCVDCAVSALANVKRRHDERTDYVYPWTFAETGGPRGQRALSRLEQDRLDDPEGAGLPGMPRTAKTTRTPEFSYVRLPGNKATVTCTCGWKDPMGPMPVSPFDPREALAAAQAEHPRCPDPEKR